MLCENAYYRDNKLYCQVKNDVLFGDRCPLVYLCRVSMKFENTTDFFDCPYRKSEVDSDD